jgi:hypothetical protein
MEEDSEDDLAAFKHSGWDAAGVDELISVFAMRGAFDLE